jgi:hypothetical protein
MAAPAGARASARVAWDVYNLSATLAWRKFAATYRRHVAMLVVFVLLVVFATAMILNVASRAVSTSGTTDLTSTITPGSLAAMAFVLLFARAFVDVSRGVLRDRAIWSTLTSPAPEGAVRAGLLLRAVVFQAGLLAAVLALVALVLATSPTPPHVPTETGPLVVLAGVASSALALPLLANAGRGRPGWAVAAALVALAGAFLATLQLGAPIWTQAAAGASVLAASVAATVLGGPSMAEAWASANRPPAARSRRNGATPPLFEAAAAGLGPTGRALLRKEAQLAFPMRQRLSVVALNLAMCVALLTLDHRIAGLVGQGPFDWGYYHYLVTPFIVGLGVFAVAFFQVTSPLLDAFTKEGPALWVLRTSPADPRTIVVAKARPVLAFLPLTVMAVGVAVPLVGGRGPAAIAVAALGTAGTYLAFAGAGAWAGATYPNIDRHSNAPPDLVLAFNMMVMCLVIEAMMLGPVIAVASYGPLQAVVAAALALVAGLVVYWIGIDSGARALGTLELAG